MKLHMVRIDPDGTVHCPQCNGTTFIYRKSRGPDIAVGLGAASAR
jgi:hypothetical protein